MQTLIKNFQLPLFIILTLGYMLNQYDLGVLDDHAWRQSLTISMAKNLLNHPNPFFPRTIFCCNGDYIIGAEFPFFNLLLAGLYKIFGFEYWYGRPLNLIITTIGIYYFYKIVKDIFTQDIALCSCVLILSSVVTLFARKSMPDTFALSLVIFAVWHFTCFSKTSSTTSLLLGSLFLLLGGLSKFPSYCVLAMLLGNMKVKEIFVNKKLFISILIPSCLIAVWYLFWMPHLSETYGNQLVWPTSVFQGLKQIYDDSQHAWYRLEINAFSNRIPFLFTLMGLGIAFYKKDYKLIAIFVAYSFMYIGFISKAGAVFSGHNYYIIPFVPMLALLAGYAISILITNDYLKFTLISILFFIGITTNFRNSKSLDNLVDYPKLTELVNKYCGQDDKVMINNGQFNPIGLFYCNRFGWSENNDVLAKKEWMPDFKKNGLKLIVVDKRNYPDANLQYEKLYEDNVFAFYKP